ncbi:MAG: M23 family metallopeptidase [Anaerolineae bacterium]|nr:M23 family metallopeptidase [Anaerolineae bacterium]
MTRSLSHFRRSVAPAATLLALGSLLAAGLACDESNVSRMRARDIPEWACPSPTPIPECLITPSAEPGTPVPTYDYPADCFLPTATPFVLHEDFRLGRRVRIGGVMGIGLGIWVTMDDVEMAGPFTVTNPLTSETDQLWIAKWSVRIENASLTNAYEVYPFSQLYVLTVDHKNGSAVTGAWGLSAEAHKQIGLDELPLDEDTAILDPGERITYIVAAYVPGPWVRELAYVLDPFDEQNIEDMIEHNSLGSNVGVWITDYMDPNACPYADIEPLPYQFTGDTEPGTYVPGFLLTRHPVAGISITRGFGCHEFFTGIYGNGCEGEKPWFHNGIDYAWASNSPIYDPLPGPGSIVFAGQDDRPDCSYISGSLPPHLGLGNFIKQVASVDGHSLVLKYGHLTSFNTHSGATTIPGQVLGGMGSTGCSTGSHLHFQVQVDGYMVNPALLIPPNAPP